MALEVFPVEVGDGWLCVGHRPGKSSFSVLRDAGVTHVITLLGPAEGAEELIGRIKAAGFESIWLPLAGAKPVDDPDRLEEITAFYGELRSLLQEGNTLFLHCSAGIHRTGMIAYGLLRYLGLSEAEGVSRLGRMRQVTIDGVTDARLEWGEQFEGRGAGAG